MNLRHAATLLRQRCFGRWHQESPPTTDETRQFDLLMKELHTREQQLPANHWTLMAQTFEERLSLEGETTRAPRLSRLTQWQPYVGALVPLGGLLALGLALHTPGQDAASESVFDATALSDLWGDSHYNQITAEPLPVRDERPRAESSTPRSSLRPPTRPPPVTIQPSERVSVKQSTTSHHGSATRSNTARSPSMSALNAETPDSSGAPLEVQLRPKHPTNPTPPIVTESTSSSRYISPESDSFTEQLLALKQADKALKAGNTSVAKEKLKREFSPQLLLHANALRAVSACQSQDKATGRRYLEFQAKRHPHSPYLDRIRRACASSSPDSK